jgi:hypothetical protein
MKETIGEKIQRKIGEDSMELKSRTRKDLFIKGLTTEEYDKFIDFIKTKTPNKKGYEAINILLTAYDKVKQTDKFIAYIDSLEQKIAQAETEEEKEKPKIIGGKKL